MLEIAPKNLLKDLHILVVGAGPGGLTFAKSALEHGALVEVIEQADDPRGSNTGYTDRSFNLTLNSVGRRVLGDERIWSGSTDVIGRAIHNFRNSKATKYTSFGQGDAALLTSIPRPILRQNMVTFAEEKGATLRFRHKAFGIDPDNGELLVENENGATATLKADLVVVADGLHSLSDTAVEALPNSSLRKRCEQLNYITVLLDRESSRNLSLHHIHFWHELESNSVAIGLPNKDGTVAVLLISRFDDAPADTSPFSTHELALSRLERDFSQLLELDPNLVNQVTGKKRGQFYYKSITNYVIGKRCVIVGDAGSASPPWAGFGANTAIYSADALVRFLVGLNSIDQALLGYEQHKLHLASLVLDYAREHGDFLSRKVAKNPEQKPIGPILGNLINIAVKESDAPEGVELLSF